MAKVPVAKVAVSAAIYTIDKPYDYLIPAEMQGTIQPGCRVLVPFGRGNRKTEGFVVQCAEIEDTQELKAISYLYDNTVVLSAADIRLAMWMCTQYFCTFFEAADAMLPPGIWQRDKTLYSPTEISLDDALEKVKRSPRKQALLQAVYEAKNPLSTDKLKKLTGVSEIEQVLQQLIAADLLQAKQISAHTTKDKQINMISLAIPLDQALKQIGTGKLSNKRLAVIQCVSQAEQMPEKEISYLTGVSESVIRRLVHNGILQSQKAEVYRRPYASTGEAAPQIQLNQEQQAAFGHARSLINKGTHAALLHGITGSGKTLVYISLIKEVLAGGKSVIFMVPEIALTPQMVQQFCQHFQNDVAVVHSGLTLAERYDEYKRIKSGNARVVIGTRSAVFAPVSDLGLIIMDEEQEHSYRSSDVAPRYHARDIAKYRAVQSECLLLLGSATPSIESFYSAKQGKYTLLELKHRYQDAPLPETVIADMRDSLRSGEASQISNVLRNAIQETLNRGEQSILFINRRGNSRMMTCADCGHIPMCENCSSALTYHSKNDRLMCHHCGYSIPKPNTCPECGSEHLRFTGVGTQKVEDELSVAFPQAKILRMDTDTTAQRTSHEKLLDSFAAGEADILVGTQMIAKGLDFPNVTLVGVLDADLSLYCGDYHAQERTFSLLTQVVGRAGRRNKPGRAVIQTFTPENPIITAASAQDYDAFYAHEIQSREALQAPPFSDLAVFTLSSVNEKEGLLAAQRVATTLNRYFEGAFSDLSTQVWGPVPAAVSRLNKRYRFIISFRGKNGKRMRELISRVLSGFQQAQLSRLISITAEINPYQ